MIQQQKNLILIADDDKSICEVVSRYLIEKGYTTIFTYNGVDAVNIFHERKPQLAIVDIRMPDMNGLEFLKEIRKFDSTTPVIITTGYPNMDTVMDAIHNGAYDYLVKPFQFEILHSKVKQALQALELTKENLILSELVSLHDISNKLANTHALQEVLDVTFQFCIDELKADSGSILLVNREQNTLQVARKKGVQEGPDRTSLSDNKEWPVSKWVINNSHSILNVKGTSKPNIDIDFTDESSGSIMSVPLKAEDKVIGVVNLRRMGKDNPFNEVDLNMLEVLASQAGTGINNANLYSSLNQKLSELSLISNYSDHFVGLVDLTDVISCLFETVRKYFSIDVIGFLVIKKRFHEFLYWARGNLSDELIDKVSDITIEEYNNVTKSQIMKKRVKLRFLEIASSDGSTIKSPLDFTHIIPLLWEGFNFGALFFGAEKTPENKEEKIALLTSIVNQTRIALTNAKLYSEMKENYIRTIKALAIAVDAKDTYTHGHSENVMNIAEAIAIEMNIDDKNIGIIRDGGLLHDIGKIGIPGYILNKPGPLTQEEFNGVMKTHSTLGANIVREVPFLKDLYSLILHHHEHHDGTGYPDGLAGNDIPLGARILHVADAFEAMTSNRPYRNNLGKKIALKRLKEQRGKEFDPEVVDAFISMAKKKGWIDNDEGV